MNSQVLRTLDSKGVLTVELNRPEKCNSFHGEMIKTLEQIYREASLDCGIRLVVLIGRGPVFCSGGDINWMCESGTRDAGERMKRATSISDMFDAIDGCSKPTIVAAQGVAYGGAVGLLAACDFVIVTREIQIATSEAVLGIVPACVAPFLLMKVGVSHTRRMFLSAKALSADEAIRIGLVHNVVESLDELASSVLELTESLLQVSSTAQRDSKLMLRRLVCGEEREFTDYRREGISTLSNSWASADGQEGMIAFLEKRRPSWIA